VLRSERASAAEGEKLASQMAEYRRQLDTRDKVTDSDPLPTKLAKWLGTSKDSVSLARGGYLTAIIAVFTLFLFPLCWLPVIAEREKLRAANAMVVTVVPPLPRVLSICDESHMSAASAAVLIDVKPAVVNEEVASPPEDTAADDTADAAPPAPAHEVVILQPDKPKAHVAAAPGDVETWFKERTRKSPGTVSSAKWFHEDYKLWCSARSLSAHHPSSFGKVMARLNVKKQHHATGRQYIGISLLREDGTVPIRRKA
jgi:hypothetical protein